MKNNNVIQFTGGNTLDLDPDAVLDGAKEQLDEVVVIGWDKDDCLYLAGNMAKASKVMWLLKKCEQALLNHE